jgi:hypothetical protein
MEFDGLFKRAEIALFLTESKFEMLFQTDLHGSH